MTLAKYATKILPFYPNHQHIEAYVHDNGINAFYESVALRQECCFIRKVEPLQRALKEARNWITGLRAEQSNARKDLSVVEWDDEHQLYKINPLLEWSLEDVMSYLDLHNVPYNKLHNQGYVSIGCAPCTRAIKPGEDFRVGRWWWVASQKECGLHVKH